MGNDFFYCIVDGFCFCVNNYLNSLFVQFYYFRSIQMFIYCIVNVGRVSYCKVQMGDIGVNCFQVVSVVNCSNIVGCQLSQIFFSVVVGFFSNDFVFFIFMIWCFQVEYVDN